MDLTASLEKAIGHEVAVLIKEQIGEERLKKMAEDALQALTAHQGYSTRLSRLQEMALELITGAVREQMVELLKEDEQRVAIDATARKIIKEGLEEARVKSVAAISDALGRALCLPSDLFQQVLAALSSGFPR